MLIQLSLRLVRHLVPQSFASGCGQIKDWGQQVTDWPRLRVCEKKVVVLPSHAHLCLCQLLLLGNICHLFVLCLSIYLSFVSISVCPFVIYIFLYILYLSVCLCLVCRFVHVSFVLFPQSFYLFFICLSVLYLSYFLYIWYICRSVYLPLVIQLSKMSF